MNQKKIIIVFATYIVAMIIVFVGIITHIKAKDKRLLNEIYNNITEMFGGDRMHLVDVYYHDMNVVSKQMTIPKHPSGNNGTSVLIGGNYTDTEKHWKEYYGDLYQLYRLSDGYREDGWNLVRLSNTVETPIDREEYSDQRNGFMICIDYVFPYAVGKRRQNSAFLYDYMPSVKKAVEEAYDFYTTDSKSIFLNLGYENQFHYGKLVPGCYQRILQAMDNAENEYYRIEKEDCIYVSYSGTPLFGDGDRTSPYELSYMYNDYYRVFVGCTQPTTYSVHRKPWHPERIERRKLFLWWGVGLTLIMLSIVIPLSINKKGENTNI